MTELTSIGAGVMAAVLAVQAAREMGIPSPGVIQATLLYSGYLLANGEFGLGGGLLLAVVAGTCAGAAAMYCIGRFGGARLRTFFTRRMAGAHRPGGWVGSLATRCERLAEWCRARGPAGSFLAVALGRFIPGFVPVASFLSGMARVRPAAFGAGVALWLVICAGLFVLAGMAGTPLARAVVENAGENAGSAWAYAGIAAAAMLAIAVTVYALRRRGTAA